MTFGNADEVKSAVAGGRVKVGDVVNIGGQLMKVG
jgi:hypothetical protein